MATEDPKNTPDLGEQAIALAEQFGRVAGTIQGTAEAWVQRQQLTDQLTRVRDGATGMLKTLKAKAPKGRFASKRKPAKAASASRTRKADPAHAPGKRHRKPAPTKRGVKKSNQAIPKMRTAAAARQRRKSFA